MISLLNGENNPNKKGVRRAENQNVSRMSRREVFRRGKNPQFSA